MQAQNFGHRAAGGRPEFANWRSIFHAASGLIEAAGRRGADEHASGVAPLRTSGFKCAEHASTDTAKPRVPGIVEGDLPRVGDGTHREDYPVLDGNKQQSG